MIVAAGGTLVRPAPAPLRPASAGTPQRVLVSAGTPLRVPQRVPQRVLVSAGTPERAVVSNGTPQRALPGNRIQNMAEVSGTPGRTLRFVEPSRDDGQAQQLALARPPATTPGRVVKPSLRRSMQGVVPAACVGGDQMKSASSGSRNGEARSAAVSQRRESVEPQLLVLRLMYLSRIPQDTWFNSQAKYQLSVHVGEDARADPPAQPGKHATPAVVPTESHIVPPEEEIVRKRIATAINEMRNAQAKEQGGGSQSADINFECRYKTRIAIRLSEAGPGPAAGGPSYFRVDVWSERKGGLFGKELQRELFARVFVPITEPNWQRRPCTWPAVNAEGEDVAYLTCEFAFVRAPAPVQDLHVDDVAPHEIVLAWQPPPNDKVAPITGYRVEKCNSGPGLQGRPPSWQTIDELEPIAAPRMVIPNLRFNSKYRFRVTAMNEAGMGDYSELEATTGPGMPGSCGQPRLAACAGPVLTVEWDPPVDDGGAPVVAYRVWVRPFTASAVDAPSWMELGQVKHNKLGVQRAEIHTEDLNPSISRYLCRMAAVNETGEMGPTTADSACLPFPNPCAVCGPSPPAVPQICDYDPYDMPGGSGNIVLTDTVSRALSMQFNTGPLTPLHDPVATLVEHGNYGPYVPHSHADYPHNWGPDFQLQVFRKNVPVDSVSYATSFHENGGYSGDTPPAPAEPFPEPYGELQAQNPRDLREQQDMVRQRLQEKKELLESSLTRYRQAGEQLKYCPDNQLLRQSHEEAEIEAAGYQAEVAVLSQHLNDVDEALRGQEDAMIGG